MVSYPLQLDLPFKQTVRMAVHEQGDLHVSAAIREQGVWEIFETQLIAACLATADNFVDVGANIGYYSVVAAGLYPELPIFAFEPEANNARVLQYNVALNQANNVRVTQAGLAANNSQAHIFLSENNFGDHQIYDRGESRNSAAIELINGSEFLKQHHIEHIDVLKIDTQGAEFEVISGLMPLLKQSSALCMVIEFWPFGLKKSGSHGYALLDLLLQLKLPMYIIDHIGHEMIACQEQQLRDWIDSLDEDAENEGFMNLFFGEVPASIAIKA